VIAHVQDHLSAYLDDELLAPERAAVETHLRACPECTRHLEELRAVDGAARELDVEAPPGYFDSLPARVGARLPVPRRGVWGVRRSAPPSSTSERGFIPRERTTPPAWVWAAAAVLVLAALTPLTFRRTKSPVPDAAKIEEADSFRPAPTTPPAAAPARAEDSLDAARDKAATVLERNAAPERKDEKRRETSLPPPAQVQRHPGPWAQSPAASQAQSAAREEVQVEAAPPTKKQAEPAGKSDRDQPRAGARAGAPPPADDAPAFAEAPGEDRYRALLGRKADSPEAARKLHDDWDAFARGHPDSPRADEARVRAMEASALAFDLGRNPRDREHAQAAAQAYLTRPDAVQAARVRALLEKLAR
jgi:putative zinc finger protein